MKELPDLQPKPRHIADMANHSMSDGAGSHAVARPVATRPFAAFEWMIALRYLRAKRTESFVSVISGFSLIGIALGVATLIIVMSVMNGFRHELLGRILGLNGHLSVQALGRPLTDFDPLVAKIKGVDHVLSAVPVVEGQVLATGPNRASGAVVRGIRPSDLSAQQIVAKNIKGGSLADFATEDDDVAVIGT